MANMTTDVRRNTNTCQVLFFEDNIHTTVTKNPAAVHRWISRTLFIHRRRLHRLVVGLDVEWRPSMITEGSPQYPVAVLQLCVGHRCLIYQMLYTRHIPGTLVRFLSNPDYTFVGVGVGDDLMKLQRDYGFGGDARFVDLRSLAADMYGREEFRGAGLKSLAASMGTAMEKPKNVAVSKWDDPWLTPEQVRYACLDAFVSFEIGRILRASEYYDMMMHMLLSC